MRNKPKRSIFNSKADKEKARQYIQEKPKPAPACGCKIKPGITIAGEGYKPAEIVYCPLHASAQSMKEAMERFCDKIATADDEMRFTSSSRKLVMDTLDDFNDVLANASTKTGGK